MANRDFQRVLDAFRALGLSAYEARAYLGLVNQSPANGNQIARRSGVPSAKVYDALARLSERGLVAALDTDPVQYVPLPVEEFVGSSTAHVEEQGRLIAGHLAEASAAARRELLWHVKGTGPLLARAARLMGSARSEILVSVWPQDIPLIRDGLREADRRGVQVSGIVFGSATLGAGHTVHHVDLPTVADRHGQQLLLTADGNEALLMERQGADWEGLSTTNAAVVRVIRNYIRHDVYVNKIAARFPDLLADTYGKELEFLLDTTADEVAGRPRNPRRVRRRQQGVRT